MVVAGDDGDVLRAAQPVLPQRLHEADRHQVVADEHRVGPALQQLEAGAIAGLDAEIAVDDQRRVEAAALPARSAAR